MISIEVNDTVIKGILARLQQRVGNLRPVLGSVATELLSITEGAFQQETDPATGDRWPDLAPSTKRQRAKIGKWPGRILQMSAAGLSASIQPDVGDDYAQVGTNKVYAAIHQFGGKAGRNRETTIPARPYLGLSNTDKDVIVEIISQHLTDSF